MEIKKIPFVPKSFESLRAAWHGIVDGVLLKNRYQ
jgi:hypothetical protein